MIHAVLLALALSPFALYAGRDAVAHVRLRKPSWQENVLHLLLGAAQVALIVSAFREDTTRLAVAGAAVTVLGALDEWGFHKELPAAESDLHAKSHFALFGFVMMALVLATHPAFGRAP